MCGGGILCGRVLHILVQPVDHLCQRVKRRLAGRIAMSFKRQGNVSYGGAVALQCQIESLRLDRECTGVVVRFAVDQEYTVPPNAKIGILGLMRLPAIR